DGIGVHDGGAHPRPWLVALDGHDAPSRRDEREHTTVRTPRVGRASVQPRANKMTPDRSSSAKTIWRNRTASMRPNRATPPRTPIAAGMAKLMPRPTTSGDSNPAHQ